MKKFISFIICLMLLGFFFAEPTFGVKRKSSSSTSSAYSHKKSVYVHSYTRKNGTVVAAHYRSAPGSGSSHSRISSTRTHHTKSYTTGVVRDSRGRIKRSSSARRAFMIMTGYPHGRPGYVIDHIIPLKRGGKDDPSNMQWQTIAEAKKKDKWERP